MKGFPISAASSIQSGRHIFDGDEVGLLDTFRFGSHTSSHLGEHPDMMSAWEGGGGSWKSGRSKGGRVNFILQISSKYGQGGEGVKKSENFADVINGCSLTLVSS